MAHVDVSRVRQDAVGNLGVLNTITKMEESRQVSFPTALQVNLPACFPHCPFNAERQAGKL